MAATTRAMVKRILTTRSKVNGRDILLFVYMYEGEIMMGWIQRAKIATISSAAKSGIDIKPKMTPILTGERHPGGGLRCGAHAMHQMLSIAALLALPQ